MISLTILLNEFYKTMALDVDIIINLNAKDIINEYYDYFNIYNNDNNFI